MSVAQPPPGQFYNKVHPLRSAPAPPSPSSPGKHMVSFQIVQCMLLEPRRWPSRKTFNMNPEIKFKTEKECRKEKRPHLELEKTEN